ncbi:MAG: hypothetical protein ACK4GN_10605 [Runella sp.]
MRISVCFLLLTTLLCSCWYRQCPIKGCKVRYDHTHGGKIVRGRGTWPRPHLFGFQPKTAEKRQKSNEKRRKAR